MAGVFSISSPCVLPLVPIYLAHIAGVTVGETGLAARATVIRNALAYVAGFSIVFVAMGAALGAVGAAAGTLDFIAQNRIWMVRIGGVMLIAFGLYQVGLVRVPFLDRDKRLAIKAGSPGSVASSFVIGVGFGAGWSPCVGPILGAILTAAAGQGSIQRGMLLLSTYAVGLGVPFMLAALAFGSASGILRRINGRLHTITMISGALMVGVGVIMLLGIYQQIFVEITRVAPWTPREPRL